MQVGPFQLVSPISAGAGFARYQAADSRSDNPVEVFLLRCDEWEPNDSAIIHKRLATANLIDSPFTRAIAGLELDGEPAYMALECLSGEKLARRTAGNCLAPHDALSLGRQIAKAMIAAHRVGFVHGAIDPRIIQRRHDQLWTIDSVSSTIGAVEGDSSLAIKFHTAESRRGQAEPACDIYGIALVLYWAMFGKNNRHGRESSVEASGIMNDVRSLPALQPAADGLTDLLVESLDEDASQRPGAAEFLQRLEDCARGVRELPTTAAASLSRT